MNINLTNIPIQHLNLGENKSVLNTTFELFQILIDDENEFKSKQELGDKEGDFVRNYYFYGELVAVAEISTDDEKLILQKLGTINGYRNEYRSCEYLQEEFEQSIENLIQKLNIKSSFIKDIPFMNGLGKFVLWDVIDCAKQEGIRTIELQKDITNEDFYEKCFEYFREDNTIQDFEIIGNIVFIYL